jgi:light-regulated signal transduction histidine kinase (bacteriophytochrome)
VLALDGSDPSEGIPAIIALRTRAPFVSNDRANDPRTVPIRDAVAAQELRASASFPLNRGGEVVGVLDVVADEVGFFDGEMTRLLALLAHDVSYALDLLAARANRDRAEAALRQLNATLEARVNERTQLLEAANRELEAFSYSVSHDLRAPLRAISGFTDIVLERSDGAIDDESRAHLGRVKAAAARMSQLIDDLLNLSRIARAEFNRRETSLSAIASDIVAELAEAEPTRSVDVRIADALTASADPGLARVLLANLLGNAWKFSGRRERATIEFGSSRVDGVDAFFVRDNGAGFDAAHADKLFAPFQRLHNEREFPGTGIGLALAQRVVHRHGGRIWADAAVDAGATFYFTLPT